MRTFGFLKPNEATHVLRLNSAIFEEEKANEAVDQWKKVLNESHTPVYSKRSMYEIFFERTIGTKQGYPTDSMKRLCSEGVHVLITRHPIVRFISAWNDKFSWNRKRFDDAYCQFKTIVQEIVIKSVKARKIQGSIMG